MLATILRTSFAILGPSGSDRGYEHSPPRDPWLVVPRNETRSLTLNVDSGRPVTIRNADEQGNIRSHMSTPVCRVRVVGNQLIIEGLSESSDIPIDLVHGGREIRILVSIKSRRTLPIVAHYVEHGPLLKTRMTPKRLREVLGHANGFLSQANVRLSLAVESVLGHERLFRADPAAKSGAATEPSKRSLGLVVKNKDEYDRLVRHRLALPRAGHLEYPVLNVFFVRNAETGDLTPGDATKANAFTMADGNCLFGDYIGLGREVVGVFHEGRTLAHECVHHLMFLRGHTESHHVLTDPYNLMSEQRVKFHATRLTREQIEAINPGLPFKPYDGKIKLPLRS